jgi:outer membrane cobalamin receptor
LKSAAYIAISLIVIVAAPAYSRQYFFKDSVAVSSSATAAADSLQAGRHLSGVDSVRTLPDSIRAARADTIGVDSVRSRFIPGMGHLLCEADTSSVLYQKQVLWSDAKYFGDLIWKLPGFYYRDLGEAGKWGELNAFGVDGRGIAILLDGRPMNDPVTGTYNIYDLPLEFFDNTEMLSGSASMLASDAGGMSLNFISRSYNSYRATTKLRFVQEPKGTILTDGLFTQNVARGLNLMIGVQRTVTAGRFLNADLDAWNIRTRLRYNFSDRFNIALTDFYTKAGNGLNGGVDQSRSSTIFNETGAYVLNETAWDKRSRHDVTLSVIARILSDSSSTTHANIYYSNLDREYKNPQDYNDDSTKASFWGVHLQQQLLLYPIHITFGGNWERRQIDSTRTLPFHIESENSLLALAELRLTDIFTPSISLRSTLLDGQSTLSTGAGIKSAVAGWLTVSADASWFDRFPTIQERYWRDSTFLRTGEIQKEQHTFFQSGISVKAGSSFQLSLVGFQREVIRAIVFRPTVTANGSPAISITNVGKVKSLGLNGNVVFHWRRFEVFGVMTLTRYTEADTLKTPVPDVIFSGELSYRDRFFKEKLDAKFGVRSRFYNRQQGMQFDPQTLSYIQYKSEILGRSTTLDLFMILKIGDAHISLSLNNILNVGYIFAPIYPMPGRNIRLGVNWVFLD